MVSIVNSGKHNRLSSGDDRRCGKSALVEGGVSKIELNSFDSTELNRKHKRSTSVWFGSFWDFLISIVSSVCDLKNNLIELNCSNYIYYKI